jgi:hypothetical protein
MLDDWTLKQARKSKRSPIGRQRIDDRVVAEVRRKFAGLEEEMRQWETAGVEVPLVIPAKFGGFDGGEMVVDVRVIEDLIFETDRIAQRVSEAYSQGQTLDLTGQELAERMRAVAESSPGLL